MSAPLQHQAFGDNLLDWGGSGVYIIYCADVNGDGLVDLSDMVMVEQNSNLFISSVLP